MNMTPNPIIATPQGGQNVRTGNSCQVNIHQGSGNLNIIGAGRAGAGAVDGGVTAASASEGDAVGEDEEGDEGEKSGMLHHPPNIGLSQMEQKRRAEEKRRPPSP